MSKIKHKNPDHFSIISDRQKNILQKVEKVERDVEKKEKIKKEKEEIREIKKENKFLEKNPNGLLDNIQEKINQTEFNEWEIERIKDLLEKDLKKEAINKLNELVELNEKELNHLKKLPSKIILELFKKENILEEELI